MSYVFLNGEIVPEHQACLSVMDRGLLYGDGFFETILGIDGKPEFLHEHLRRLGQSCRQFRIGFRRDAVDWEEVIRRLLEANHLARCLSAIKIIVTRGVGEPGLNLTAETTPTIIILARPYTGASGRSAGPPPDNRPEKRDSLVVFPQPHASPLARHKSLNYLYCLAARQFALERKADEAILVNPEGKVLECAAANIFYRRGTTIVKPPQEAPYLQGIVEQKILPLLGKGGYTLREEYFSADQMMEEASEIFISNSLIGVMPVAWIEGRSCRTEYRALYLLQEWLSDHGRKLK